MGLDRSIATEVFIDFLAEDSYTSKQIKFVNEIINELTNNGVMELERLYEQPFNEITSSPDELFNKKDPIRIFDLINLIRERAIA